MERRTFLSKTALATTAASARRVLGANERLRGGVIGSGGRGQYLSGEFKEIGAEIAAVCDVYEPNLQGGLKAASTGARPFDNYKQLLEDKSLDFVIVATPDHWHAQQTIDAVQAGKDVYVEKPMAHTIEEGFRMIRATRQTRRVVQVGTQRRSNDLFMQARRIIEQGDAGEVRLVNSWWVNYAGSLKGRELKGKLDWQQWLGPAPKRELDPVRFFGWYFFFDYSGGMLVGQAAHIVDAINMLMKSSFPSTVTCSGISPNVEGAEIPETASMIIEYPENFLAVFTIGYKAMRYAMFNDQMKQFHGNKARFDVGREAYALYPQSTEIDMKPSVVERRPGSFNASTRSHIRNFLECVRSREDPNATVEMGQWTSVSLCMAIESLRTGKRMVFDPKIQKMKA
ncbi:MAG: Gfo/Idh/MocA family oxidoreductase [Bryobacteraceae bacterium]|nr:Gfo/Idh/MocA family oxidoreductase [Bryobacteraceae bacterium]